ncbi:MAG: leucyl/phenylalanyl-tRNA--protein transferase [Nitrospirae bacterium]|nr:leucyl/phenylalanyl-tRNA--protein transferase [Nitrospirota bacterium]
MATRLPFNADLVIRAYMQGIFPMADENGEIRWYAPDPRAIIDLDRFHVSRRLARTVRQGRFEVRIDADFHGTVIDCSGRDETWISGDILRVYTDLHRMGLAHSVECWRDGARVGGLYGVALGGAFMGESMFSARTDASKVALVALVERLKARGFTLLDTQFMTPHLARQGAHTIPLAEYRRRLDQALSRHCRFAD